jgi:hypothetical protein
MADVRFCCQAIDRPKPSPFEIAQLDWYDGVTEGLARCEACGATYTFDVVCSSKDGVRIYGFARIAETYYRAMTAVLEKSPPSPEKVTEWQRELAMTESQVPKAQSERDLFVIARDLEEEVLLARRMAFPELREVLERIGIAP